MKAVSSRFNRLSRLTFLCVLKSAITALGSTYCNFVTWQPNLSSGKILWNDTSQCAAGSECHLEICWCEVRFYTSCFDLLLPYFRHWWQAVGAEDSTELHTFTTSRLLTCQRTSSGAERSCTLWRAVQVLLIDLSIFSYVGFQLGWQWYLKHHC
jgi:hypothetical protein